jgi:DNA polymerase IV
MHRVFFHLDMDAFYASVEQRDNPKLRGKPVIVGAPPTQRGVVCAASYEARKFGVHSAMPSATAGRLCPKGIFVRPRMEAYKDESRQIMQLVAETGAVIEQMSIDEAYLDLSGLCQAEDADTSLLQSRPLPERLKQRILTERHLTATIGIAANKLLAKIASDHQKPDGLTLITEKEKVQFLRPLPVRALYGVGKVTEQILRQAGMETVGDLQDYSGDLRALVGSFGPKLKGFAFGQDDRPLDQRRGNLPPREALSGHPYPCGPSQQTFPPGSSTADSAPIRFRSRCAMAISPRLPARSPSKTR